MMTCVFGFLYIVFSPESGDRDGADWAAATSGGDGGSDSSWTAFNWFSLKEPVGLGEFRGLNTGLFSLEDVERSRKKKARRVPAIRSARLKEIMVATTLKVKEGHGQGRRVEGVHQSATACKFSKAFR